jgi:hypothetical protein
MAGEYEDALDDNSTWEEGDWNDDGDFTSTDLVLAFAAGAYSPEASAGHRRGAQRLALVDRAWSDFALDPRHELKRSAWVT